MNKVYKSSWKIHESFHLQDQWDETKYGKRYLGTYITKRGSCQVFASASSDLLLKLNKEQIWVTIYFVFNNKYYNVTKETEYRGKFKNAAKRIASNLYKNSIKELKHGRISHRDHCSFLQFN